MMTVDVETDGSEMVVSGVDGGCVIIIGNDVCDGGWLW